MDFPIFSSVTTLTTHVNIFQDKSSKTNNSKILMIYKVKKIKWKSWEQNIIYDKNGTKENQPNKVNCRLNKQRDYEKC